MSYYQSKENVEEYIKMAECHDGREMINLVKGYLRPDHHILELGSGPGTDWLELSKYYETTGSDNSQAFLQHLNNKYSKGQFLELDAVSIATEQNFDAIYSNKVLHHLSDQEFKQSIQRQYELLNPKGIIAHSLWKGQGSEEFNGMYVNYHEPDQMADLIDFGFEILNLKLYKEFEDDDSFILIARKK